MAKHWLVGSAIERMLGKIPTTAERIVALTYQSGEEIRGGDRVTYGGHAGTIELVAEAMTGDFEADWLFENHGDDGRRLWLFKEPESPPSSDENGPLSEPLELIGFPDEQLHEIVDFGGLMQRLREIAADHPLKPVAQTAEEPATAEDFQSLPPQVAKFLNDPEFVSLSMTIRFTDDGLSLGREEGGYAMTFVAHPRRDPKKASRALSLFAELGVQPHVDYLSDRGRTRVLEFRIPSEPGSIADLCSRVLAEMYAMRRGDVLDYHLLKKADLSSP